MCLIICGALRNRTLFEDHYLSLVSPFLSQMEFGFHATVALESVMNWKIYFTVVLLRFWHTIFLFNTVKLLWHNLYCIEKYRNKGDLTWSTVMQETNQNQGPVPSSKLLMNLFPNPVPGDIPTLRFLTLPNQTPESTHQFTGWDKTPTPEMDGSDKGHIQNVYCWCASRNRVGKNCFRVSHWLFYFSEDCSLCTLDAHFCWVV